jgi:NAD(P)-dependent dehydrogenase (short-subunit alcohol dehydrogenase family)
MTVTRRVLVTGGAKRIGAAICQRLARDGWAIAVHYHQSGDEARALAETLGKAAAVQADLAALESLPQLIAEASAALGGPLDALINNASLFEQDQLGNVTPDSFARLQTINLAAPLMLTQAFAAQALGAGAVVNLVDQRVWRLNPTFLSYTLAKSGLWALTQMAAQALAPRIRVNAVGPGPVLQSIHQDAAVFAAEAAAVPLGRAVEPVEIAAAVQFLLDSPAITGQMIAVDSGQHLAWRTPDVEVQLP